MTYKFCYPFDSAYYKVSGLTLDFLGSSLTYYMRNLSAHFVLKPLILR